MFSRSPICICDWFNLKIFSLKCILVKVTSPDSTLPVTPVRSKVGLFNTSCRLHFWFYFDYGVWFVHNRMILQIQVHFMIHCNPWKGGELISVQSFGFCPTFAVGYICLNVFPCTHVCWTTSAFLPDNFFNLSTSFWILILSSSMPTVPPSYVLSENLIIRSWFHHPSC